MRKALNIPATAALVASLAIALLGGTPASALAAEDPFITPSLTETVQVQTTGELHVVEQRTFLFNQPAQVLRWTFTGLPGESEVSVASVRMAEVDDQGNLVSDWVTLPAVASNADWRDSINGSGGMLPTDTEEPSFPTSPAWALDARRYQLYVFFEPEAQRVMFEVDWSATNAVRTYDDVAELQWDYVPERADMDTLNVQVSVQLPVPEGAQIVPSETVLAWGHGAPGEVSVAADGTISYHVPQVRAGQYALAHILFPANWMTNLSADARQAYSGIRLDNAKAEEEAWTDTYHNQLINQYSVNLAVVAVCAVVLVVALALYLICGRERRHVVSIAPGEVRRLASDELLMARFIAWDHVQPGEPDPDALSRRMATEGLFDARSFRLQKALFAVAGVLLVCAILSVALFDAWIAAAVLLVTTICVAIIANYLPRRTPKGIALAAALNDREPDANDPRA